MINLRVLAGQQKNQRILKITNRFLGQTHDIKLAENLFPITKKVEVNKSTQKLGDVIKESNSENENNQEVAPHKIDSEDDNNESKQGALPNSNKFSTNMMETLGALMDSKNSLKLIQNDSGRASILGIPIHTLGGDRMQINDNVYNLTLELFIALSSISFSGKTMKNDKDE